MRTDLATGRSAGPLLWLKMHRLLEYCLGGSIICGGCLQVVGVCLPRMWYLWAVPLLCAFNSPCCSTSPSWTRPIRGTAAVFHPWTLCGGRVGGTDLWDEGFAWRFCELVPRNCYWVSLVQIDISGRGKEFNREIHGLWIGEHVFRWTVRLPPEPILMLVPTACRQYR